MYTPADRTHFCAQPAWGSTLDLSALQAKVDAKAGWSQSYHGDIESEKKAAKRDAVNRLMHVATFLESKSVKLGVRQLVSNDDELKELLGPRRPGTLIRQCRMFLSPLARRRVPRGGVGRQY